MNPDDTNDVTIIETTTGPISIGQRQEALNLRASAMPLAFICAGSVRLPELRVDPDRAEARLGTAAHAALRALPDDGELDWAGLREIAARHRVDETDLRIIVAVCRRDMWPLLRDRFAGALTEVELSLTTPSGHRLTGHIDLLASGVGSHGELGDWKSGFRDSPPRHQLFAYAVLALADDAQLDQIDASAFWLRSGEVETFRISRARAQEWIEDLEREVIAWDGVYRPGPHCAHCPRSHECSAANAILRRDVAAILDLPALHLDLVSMPKEQIVELAKRASMVAKMAEHVRDALRAHVAANGGEIAAPDGRLVLQAEERVTLDTAKAWPVLEAHGFDDEDFAACVKIGLAAAGDRLAQRAGKGKGAAAKRALREALDEAGAVSKTELVKLVVKRGTGSHGDER